jgi:hypothetical protein
MMGARYTPIAKAARGISPSLDTSIRHLKRLHYRVKYNAPAPEIRVLENVIASLEAHKVRSSAWHDLDAAGILFDAAKEMVEE